MTAWSHLPNAVHIDRVIADLRANPKNWSAAWDDARYAALGAWSLALDAVHGAARHAVWDATLDGVWDAARDAALDAALNATRSAARDAAWGTVLALVAWDTSSDLLNATADEVRLLADLGDNRAILMLPAIIAFEKRAITA